MESFNKKITNALNGKVRTKDVLEYLSKVEKNLINNFSNPAFSKNDRNKLMQKCNALSKLGKSLYRFNTLKQNNISASADNEKSNISNLVLKGRISNCKYVWHSENSDTTCEICRELDGKEFNFEDEVPQRPHPNCRCTIEIVEMPIPEEELCDCMDRIDSLIAELENGASEAESAISEVEDEIGSFEEMKTSAENMLLEAIDTIENLSEEYGQHLSHCENNIDSFYNAALRQKEKIETVLKNIMNSLNTIRAYVQVFGIFAYHFAALLVEAYILEKAGMDKYRHSVANCHSAQLGELEEQAATVLSDFKEQFDQYKNSYARTHKVSVEEALADSERDQVANRLGRERGRNNPDCDCRILMQDLKPTRKKKNLW